MFVIFTVLAVVHMIYTMMRASRCICLYIHLGIPLMYGFIIVYIIINQFTIAFLINRGHMPLMPVCKNLSKMIAKGMSICA